VAETKAAHAVRTRSAKLTKLRTHPAHMGLRGLREWYYTILMDVLRKLEEKKPLFKVIQCITV
jgi:hypothetical protein